MNKEENTNTVPAVERALNIFEYLARQSKPQSLSTICSDLKTPTTSTFRCIKYLCSRGYVEEVQGQPSRYQLGIQLMRIVDNMKNSFSLYRLAAQSMKDLVGYTDQAVQLGILKDNAVIYIEQMLPHTPVSIISPTNTPLAINTSASGKIILANLDIKQQGDIINQLEFDTRTEKSIKNVLELEEELKKVVRDGYAMDNEEFAVGIGCMAAPIFDMNGKCIAALGITGHIKDYNDTQKRDKLVFHLLDEANKISTRLGYIKSF